MSSLGSGTLPRRPPVAPDYRAYVCKRCAASYHSPSGIEPDVCPTCRMDPDWQAEKRAQVRERRKVREARARARGRG